MSIEPGRETLSFLFADLESSTRLWEQFPDAMRVAMARYDEILRSSVEGNRGSVVKTTGDGLMAAFPSACDAVLAAISAQRGLLVESWGEVGILRTRMGLHSGEAQAREGDYFGPPVYRAARIMAAAHGGQVLLSGLTAALARPCGLPAEVTLRDLGEHGLRDLLQPEHIFQLAHPQLPSEFPPLATLARRPNNLPTQTSELIGRAEELRQIRHHLDSSRVRLLTLTGPGGIGKTRLAVQAAADQIDRFADGVFLVDLSAAREADAALGEIVRTIGLTAQRNARWADVLRDQLQQRQLLLLLDNFEQVMTAADAIAELLKHCPGLKVLVTSREALRVRGEQHFPVAPLALPDLPAGQISASSVAGYDAVRLFVDRAQAARPDFVLSDANAAVVAEICARLDGLPLAIELAAARLKLFSPDHLRDRLRQRLEVLRGGARDLPARQQTLRSTIEWSYELLDDDERAVFKVLAVFAGARLESVEQVTVRAAPVRDLDVIECLASLVDKSLVRSVEERSGQRLSMLETIREYAAERLDEEPTLAVAARRSHGEYFAEFAATRRAALHGADREVALQGLSYELANLQAAWRYWVEAGDIGQLRTLLDALWILHEARGWYHGAIALASDLLAVLERTPPSPERVEEELTLRMSLARGLLAIRGYTTEVEDVYRAALVLAESIGELPRQLPVLRSLANFHLYRGELDKVMALGRQILDLGRQQNDSQLLLEGHFLVGTSVALAGDVTTGQEHLARTTALFDPQRHGSARLRLGPSPGVTAYTTSALLYWLTGYPDSADRQAANALELAARLEHPYTLAYARFHVGLLNIFNRRFSVAAEHAAAVLRIAEEREYPIWRALALVLQAVPMAHLGRPDEGLASSQQGLALYQDLSTPPIFWPLVLALHAEATARAGNPARGMELLDEALGFLGEADLNRPYFEVGRATLLAGLGEEAEAEAWFRRGLTHARRVGAVTAELRAAVGLVQLRLSATADEDSALLRSAIDRFSEGANSPDLAEARQLLAGP